MLPGVYVDDLAEYSHRVQAGDRGGNDHDHEDDHRDHLRAVGLTGRAFRWSGHNGEPTETVGYLSRAAPVTC